MNGVLDSVVAKVVLGIIRHMITTWGGTLVAKGLMTQSQETQAIGAIMVVVPIGFSIYDKMQAQQAAAAAKQGAK
jgi:hypothetical protein